MMVQLLRYLLGLFAFGAGLFTAAFVLMALLGWWETRGQKPRQKRGTYYDHE